MRPFRQLLAPAGPAVALLLLVLLVLGTACSGPPVPGAGATEAILAPASPTSSPGASTPDGPGPLPTVVVRSTIPGPAGPGSTVATTATCPGGTQLVGGGASTLLEGGAKPPSSLHIDGTFPAAAAGGQAPRAWTTVGATGGQFVAGAVTSNLALCALVTATSLQVVEASVPGAGQAATVTRATASCPAGTTLLGGGGATQAPGSSPSLHLLGSFPSGPGGAPASSGSSPASWSARADSGGRGGTGTRTIAYALCAAGAPAAATQVVARTVAGPTASSSVRTATATCPAGTSLLSGGVNAGLHSGKAPQQGIHLTGSFPSNAAGTMVTTSGSATSWTGRAEAGGQSAPSTETTAFAVCAAGP